MIAVANEILHEEKPSNLSVVSPFLRVAADFHETQRTMAAANLWFRLVLKSGPGHPLSKLYDHRAGIWGQIGHPRT
jgi:hypothetical protein